MATGSVRLGLVSHKRTWQGRADRRKEVSDFGPADPRLLGSPVLSEAWPMMRRGAQPQRPVPLFAARHCGERHIPAMAGNGHGATLANQFKRTQQKSLGFEAGNHSIIVENRGACSPYRAAACRIRLTVCRHPAACAHAPDTLGGSVTNAIAGGTCRRQSLRTGNY